MRVDEHVNELERQGGAVADAAAAAGPDAAVPTCPGWTVRHLLTHTGVPYRLAVAPDDVAERWLVETGPGGATTRRGTGAADAVLRGSADRLYLFLWNRVPTVPVEGDAAAAARWREGARVTWA